MITRVTVFVVLVLSLAAYAASPSVQSNSRGVVVCCDGDPS